MSPDRYIVDKASMTTVTREVRRKELVTEAAAGGGTVTRALYPEEGSLPVLNDDEVRRLADMAVRIERHYGSAQDTE